MSGQYPPPNPAHPFTRVPVPTQRVMPPWGHPTQPTPGLNMVGGPMNYFGPPHVGLRGTQPWGVPQRKPADARPISANPLFGLQAMMGADAGTRIPSEFQQEESMDLSSHPVKTTTTSLVSSEEDTVRNGTLSINGDARTEREGGSVIATNPLRDACVEPVQAEVKEVSEPVSDFSSAVKDQVSEPVVSSLSLVTTAPSITPSEAVMTKDDDGVTEVDRIRDFIMKIDKPLRDDYGFENKSDSLGENKMDEFLDESALSVDTDESKLVVAESSAEDIFGISPVGDVSTDLVHKDSKDTFPNTSELQVALVTEEKSVGNPVAEQPQPSAENVEILLENMFNSQEENSCSSQTSCGIPQSVIVSGSGKAAETVKPSVDIVSPMKVEDLASTLAEDTPVKCEVKEEKKEDRITDDVMQEIEKKLEMLTENASESVNQVKGEMEVKEKETPGSESVGDKPAMEELETHKEVLPVAVSTEDKEAVVELPTRVAKAGTGTAENPFIEVESELEKMFAGIVEPVEGSEGRTQNVAPETKKTENKRTVTKRKKANNRRPSDCSVFGGGSSGESTPVKKRGRKRGSDGNNERKKIKLDGSEKKKRVAKDIGDLGKAKGPFVHVEGPKESPTSVVVVNSGVRPDDEDVQKDKASHRRKHSSVHRAEGVSARKAYNSSTLSARYNAESADLTWVCALCHRGPHCQGGLGGEPAGDLFGPYRVPAVPPTDDGPAGGAPADSDVAEEQKRRGGKYPKSLRASGGAEAFVAKMAKKSKRSQSMESVEGPGLLPVEGSYEVWLHSACAEWAPGLCVVGTSLVGLDEAVWTAIRTRCSSCGEQGAGVGCVVRSCPARVHYPCARLCGWLLDHETFIARCHVHRTRLRPS